MSLGEGVPLERGRKKCIS